MAFPDDVTLDTQDPAYPHVVAKIDVDGAEKGEDEDGTLWRTVVYQVWDQLNGAGDMTVGKAGHLSDLFMDSLKGVTNPQIFTGFNWSMYRQAHRYPANERLMCVAVRGQFIGARRPGPKLVETDFVRVFATYRSVPYVTSVNPATGLPTNDPYNPVVNSLGGVVMPYVSVRTSTSPKETTIDRSSVKSDSDPNSQFSRGFRQRKLLTTYHLTYHSVPFLGDEWNALLHDAVNLNAIFQKDPETLLFDGAVAEPTGIGGGIPGNDVTVDLIWDPDGWNKQIPVGKVNPERVVFLADATRTPYRRVSFSSLILSPP
jgi:hypothetical protein